MYRARLRPSDILLCFWREHLNLAGRTEGLTIEFCQNGEKEPRAINKTIESPALKEKPVSQDRVDKRSPLIAATSNDPLINAPLLLHTEKKMLLPCCRVKEF